MGEIINLGRHKLHSCDSDDCFTCSARLSLCIVCHGAEGALPTHCPGTRMNGDQIDLVHEGRLDYHRRYGWIRRGQGQVL